MKVDESAGLDHLPKFGVIDDRSVSVDHQNDCMAVVLKVPYVLYHVIKEMLSGGSIVVCASIIPCLVDKKLGLSMEGAS